MEGPMSIPASLRVVAAVVLASAFSSAALAQEVDLVHAVRVFRKVRPWCVDISTDRVALRLELPSQRLLTQFAVSLGIPVMN